MQSGPHLILHKVRGEPAYDIAEQIQIGNEWGWIIPTSGHRAYPYWTIPLTGVMFNIRGNEKWSPADDGYTWDDITDAPPMPTDLRDHYTVTKAPRVTKSERGQGLAKLVGLSAPKLKIRRMHG